MAGDDWKTKRVFTTGEAAKVCKVSQQTIIRCFDAGRLEGFRVPGSRFRRIPRESLIRFMHANEIPTDTIDTGVKRVLIVDDEPGVVSLIRDILLDDGRFEVESAATGYDAGLQTERFKPHLILLDYKLPDINGNVVCERVRAGERGDETRILIVSGVARPSEVEALLEAGADGYIAKPFDTDDLLARTLDLLGMDVPGSAETGD